MFSRGHFTAIKFLHAQNFFEKLLAPARGIAYINNPQADMAQLVEHNLAKVGVAGSSPVVRSKRNSPTTTVAGLFRTHHIGSNFFQIIGK